MEETKQTGFHNSFSNHTRNFVEYSGYWLPNAMTNYGAIEEYWACREKAAIMDLSPLRKYEITGPDAKKLMQNYIKEAKVILEKYGSKARPLITLCESLPNRRS